MIFSGGCNYFRSIKVPFSRAHRNMDKPLGLRGLRNYKRCRNDITFLAKNIVILEIYLNLNRPIIRK